MHMNACTVTPRAAHTMCAVAEQLVIFGGRDCESRVNDLHFYDTGKIRNLMQQSHFERLTYNSNLNRAEFGM